MPKISMDKKYVTRAGEPVRILCTDCPNPAYPIVIMDNHGTLINLTEDGSLYLTDVRPYIKEAPREGFVNYLRWHRTMDGHLMLDEVPAFDSFGKLTPILDSDGTVIDVKYEPLNQGEVK